MATAEVILERALVTGSPVADRTTERLLAGVLHQVGLDVPVVQGGVVAHSAKVQLIARGRRQPVPDGQLRLPPIDGAL